MVNNQPQLQYSVARHETSTKATTININRNPAFFIAYTY